MSKTTGPGESKIIYPKQTPRRIRTLSNWYESSIEVKLGYCTNDGNSNDNGQTTTMTDDKTRLQGIISHK